MSSRWLIAAAFVICAYLVLGLPLHGAGILAVVVLAGIDVVLIQRTGALAFARERSLDERQASVRDLGYRLAFRLFGVALVAGLVLGFLGLSIGAASASFSGRFLQVDSGLGGRYVVAVIELLVMMPTFVMAGSGAAAAGGKHRWVPLLVAVVVAAASWLLAVEWAPAQAAPASRNFSISSSIQGGECRHFARGRVIGAEFGATVGMHVDVCWNGESAFVSPDRDAALSACGTDNAEDFAVVAQMTCAAATDRDGTLHYVVRARVTPLPFEIAARDVEMRLTVTRDGRVLEQL